MEIFINGEPLDYALEAEDSLGEVVDALTSWLDGGGIVVTALVADGSDLLRAPSDLWRTTPLASVGRVELSADRYEVATTEHLATLQTYLDSIIEAGESPPGTDAPVAVGIALGEIDELLDGLRTSLRLAAGGSALDLVERVSAEASSLGDKEWSAIPDDRRAAMVSALRDLSGLVADLAKSTADPVGTLPAHVRQLEEAVERIRNVSVLLQTGNDRDAMSAVVAFSDGTQRLIRTLSFAGAAIGVPIGEAVVQGKSLANFCAELNAHLRELNQAFEATDSVLIGDLLEYEIAPRIDALIAYTRELA